MVSTRHYGVEGKIRLIEHTLEDPSEEEEIHHPKMKRGHLPPNFWVEGYAPIVGIFSFARKLVFLLPDFIMDFKQTTAIF